MGWGSTTPIIATTQNLFTLLPIERHFDYETAAICFHFPLPFLISSFPQLAAILPINRPFVGTLKWILQPAGHILHLIQPSALTFSFL